MPDFAPFIAVALGLVALAIAVVSWMRTGKATDTLTADSAVRLFRDEHDRLRGVFDEQFRGMRTELGEGVRRAQETTVLMVGELGKVLKAQASEAAERLEAAVTRVETHVQTIGQKLDADLLKMGNEAAEN